MCRRPFLPMLVVCTFVLFNPVLAGEFGQMRQYFAQFGIGGPAETSFDVHNPGGTPITVDIQLFNSDGSLFDQDQLDVPAGGTNSLILANPNEQARNGWAVLTSASPFNATLFFRIQGVGNVGVEPSEEGVKFRLFSFVGTGTDTGFALANTSPSESTRWRPRIAVKAEKG